MSFPSSYTEFNHFDISSAFDLEAKLNEITMMLDDQTADLSEIKGTGTSIQTCVNKLCADDVLEAVNDLGWRLMI
jgi:hypothetical protein